MLQLLLIEKLVLDMSAKVNISSQNVFLPKLSRRYLFVEEVKLERPIVGDVRAVLV